MYICNGGVEHRRTVTQAAESVKMETTAGGRQQLSGFIATAADNFSAHTKSFLSCCFTSTEARWPIRDGDRVGRGRQSEGSTAETARKRPERPWTAARTMEVLKEKSKVFKYAK